MFNDTSPVFTWFFFAFLQTSLFPFCSLLHTVSLKGLFNVDFCNVCIYPNIVWDISIVMEYVNTWLSQQYIRWYCQINYTFLDIFDTWHSVLSLRNKHGYGSSWWQFLKGSNFLASPVLYFINSRIACISCRILIGYRFFCILL